MIRHHCWVCQRVKEMWELAYAWEQANGWHEHPSKFLLHCYSDRFRTTSHKEWTS